MDNIISSDFSVVIQGPILGKPDDAYEKQLTIQCIESIRKVLPDSEIIISTWEGSEIEHLSGYDKLIFSVDPGAVTYNDFELKNVYNNNNRQIVSTYNGLKIASRKYAIKMRSDLRLINNNFFKLIGKYNIKNAYSFFNERIIVSTYHSRNPKKVPILYQVSDIFQIGLTSDLYDLWNIPLQPEPDTTRAFPYHVYFPNDPFIFNKFKMKFSSEQYIWYAFAKKNGLDLSLKFYCEIPFKLINKATTSVISNFIIASPEQLGIYFPERLNHSFSQLYTFNEWLNHYKIFTEDNKYVLKKIFNIVVYLNSLQFVFLNLKRTFLFKFKSVLALTK